MNDQLEYDEEEEMRIGSFILGSITGVVASMMFCRIQQNNSTTANRSIQSATSLFQNAQPTFFQKILETLLQNQNKPTTSQKSSSTQNATKPSSQSMSDDIQLSNNIAHQTSLGSEEDLSSSKQTHIMNS